MSIISRIATRLFPKIMAPEELRGLSPSLAGIFKRAVLPNERQHPSGKKYTYTYLSYDEALRLEKRDHFEALGFTEEEYKDFEAPSETHDDYK